MIILKSKYLARKETLEATRGAAIDISLAFFYTKQNERSVFKPRGQ